MRETALTPGVAALDLGRANRPSRAHPRTAQGRPSPSFTASTSWLHSTRRGSGGAQGVLPASVRARTPDTAMLAGRLAAPGRAVIGARYASSGSS